MAVYKYLTLDGLSLYDSKIKLLLTDKVDKVNGKQLSTNDFADSYKQSLDNLPSSLAAKAPLTSPTFTGVPLAPTAAAGTNTTQLATTAFVNAAVDVGIGTVTGINFEIVQTLPTSNISTHTIYLLDADGTPPEVYEEYIYIDSAWELIGTTSVDLSGYVQSSELVAITNAEIDALFG